MHVWFSSIFTRMQTAKYHKLHIFVVEGEYAIQKIGVKMTSYIAVVVTTVAGALYAVLAADIVDIKPACRNLLCVRWSHSSFLGYTLWQRMGRTLVLCSNGYNCIFSCNVVNIKNCKLLC
jgi:hypothetical protein